MTSYLRPIPLTDPAALPGGMPLAGGWCRFAQVEVLRRGQAAKIVAACDLDAATLAPLITPRPPIAGIALDRPRLMGILNVTPDSFSDGGRHDCLATALAHADAMRIDGADLIDIGGESTRPGALEVPQTDEIARVVDVLNALKSEGFALPISLDTRKSGVARVGIAAGATILNDVSGLRHDPAMATVATESGAGLILMHSIGTPETMQAMAADVYDDVLLDVYDSLVATVAQAVAAGVPRARIMVDPGIGFGKTEAQALTLLQRISLFHGLGCAILLGVSRKGFIGRIGAEPRADRRGPGSAGIGLWALSQGIQMLRVHDISLHNQAIALWQAARLGQAEQERGQS